MPTAEAAPSRSFPADPAPGTFPIDPAESKRTLRAAMADRRAQGATAALNAGLAAAVLEAPFLAGDPGVVSAFWPLGSEPDLRPVLAALAARGVACALPVVEGRGRPLLFRAWDPDMVLARGAFGVLAPPDTAPPLVPDTLLVPLLAFDRRGGRLGYGGGFYDRTLAGLRARAGRRTVAAGIGFAFQEVAAVPSDANDQRLDWIVTETGAIALNDEIRESPTA